MIQENREALTQKESPQPRLCFFVETPFPLRPRGPSLANNMSSTHSFEVEMNTEYRTAVRFPAWMVLAVFSAVALAALSARIDKDERGADAKWALAVIILSMIFGTLGNLGYLFVRGIFVGQLPEAVLVRM